MAYIAVFFVQKWYAHKKIAQLKHQYKNSLTLLQITPAKYLYDCYRSPC